MSAFVARKVVGALPGTLEASTLYCVRSGAGFDLHLTNESGQIIAYPLNGGSTATPHATVDVDLGYPARRAGRFVIAGAGLTIGKPVEVRQALGPYTNKGTRRDEAEMHHVLASARVTSATEITVHWRADARVGGHVSFDYLIGA